MPYPLGADASDNYLQSQIGLLSLHKHPKGAAYCKHFDSPKDYDYRLTMIITILIDSNLNITFIKRRFSGTFPLGVGLPAPSVFALLLSFQV